MAKVTHILRSGAAAALAMGLTWAAPPAAGQSCTFAIGNINFGTFSPAAGAAVQSSATFTASCTGTRGRTVRVCPNIGSGTGGNNASASERYLRSGTNQLAYNLYSDAGFTTIWGSAVWPFPPVPPVIDIALPAGSGSASATVYGRIFAGQTTVPPGAYSSAFSTIHTLVAFQYRNTLSPQSCGAIGSSNGQQVPFTVSAVGAASCSVQATPLNFGSAANLSQNIDTTNTITVTCSRGTPFMVGLDGGLTGVSDPAARRMANSTSADVVRYGIYRDAGRSQGWGNSAGANTVAATGTGLAQTFTGYGRVPPQSSVAPLAYSDTVVATVTY